MTPQQLIDMPGYGKAEQELKKQGNWDEYAGLAEREFNVQVEYSYTETDKVWLKVKARHPDEASDKAYDLNEDDPDVVSGSTEILEVKEL
jgi:hypothetical protein